MINPPCPARVEFGAQAQTHAACAIPGFNSEQPLPGSFLQGKEGGEVGGGVRVAADWEAEINEVLSS